MPGTRPGMTAYIETGVAAAQIKPPPAAMLNGMLSIYVTR
jgi:hypothetical protein